MHKIMFVCHGNICRSPMAEFVFKNMVEERGLSDSFLIASSATSTEEIWGDVGNPVYPMAKQELEKHGILCQGKRAVQLKQSDYNKYDMFVCMDKNNLRNASRIFKTDEENKLRMLLPTDVSDPWYSERFDIAYSDIYKGCNQLLLEILCETCE